MDSIVGKTIVSALVMADIQALIDSGDLKLEEVKNTFVSQVNRSTTLDDEGIKAACAATDDDDDDLLVKNMLLIEQQGYSVLQPDKEEEERHESALSDN
jgi:hypothetical protein